MVGAEQRGNIEIYVLVIIRNSSRIKGRRGISTYTVIVICIDIVDILLGGTGTIKVASVLVI